jgi:hypothetical protein
LFPFVVWSQDIVFVLKVNAHIFDAFDYPLFRADVSFSHSILTKAPCGGFRVECWKEETTVRLEPSL